jgi:pilus assembly protein CpaE
VAREGRREARRGDGAAARRWNDRGQAAVEFAGTLPLILITLGLLWQAALTGYTFALAGNAADAAARTGAVGGDCAAAAADTLSGAWSGPAVQCGAEGGLYRARVALRVPVFFPGGPSLSLTVDGEAAAADERPEP